MNDEVRTVRIKGATILRLASGAEFRVEPAGNGITITPVTKATKSTATGDAKGGRKPSQETQALRDELGRDAASGTLRPASHYVAWLRALRPEASESSIQQIVYRERRLVLEEHPEAARAPGRGVSPVTVTLRTKLEQDRQEGELRDATHYVRWLVDAADIGLKQARPVVYRELRRIDA